PVLIWCHGGGMCIGSPEMETSKCRQWCLDHRLVVLAPAYRLAPEHKFPIGRDDCWDAFRHIVHTASAFRGDPSQGLLLGGESAGATVASTIALQARDDTSLQSQGVKVTGVFLSAGTYINALSPPPEYRPYYLSKTDSTCLAAPFLSGDTVTLFSHCYAADETSPSLRASLWPTGLKGLPKTYLQACGMDVNRDDGIVYADMLAKAGVEARLDVYEGCPHCFWFLLGETRMGRRWAGETKEGLGWLL
ncbi:Alpha/beta hydrolase fold-3, partial [Teratosphaeria nubilosa]